MVKVDAKIVLLYFSGINRTNLHLFYSFEILYLPNFVIIKEKITLLCNNIVSSHGKLNFYWSSKIQMLQLVIQVTHKNQESVLTLHRIELVRKETYRTKGLWLLNYLLFSFIFFKSTLNADFKISLLCLLSFKNIILEISLST